MLLRRTTMTAVAVVAVMIGAAACAGEDDPGPNSDPTASENPTEPTEPTSTRPSWESKYTSKQLEAYEAALDRWEKYEARSEPIWSRGKATQAAEDLFKEYFSSPIWQNHYRQLQAYEAEGITLEGRAEVFSSKPKSISKNALSVVIQQCVDYTAITGSQNGQPLEREAWAKVPRQQTISLSKPKGYDWLVYGVEDSTSKKRPPRCAP